MTVTVTGDAYVWVTLCRVRETEGDKTEAFIKNHHLLSAISLTTCLTNFIIAILGENFIFIFILA